jgi:squalene synthase HpnC
LALTASAARLETAYREVARRSRSHYENFPVASWALPRRLRRPVSALYAFARQADDLADEGETEAPKRIAELAELDAFVRNCEHYDGTDPMKIALADALQRHGLPRQPLQDLLSAFRQDVTKNRYRDFGEVMDYCRRSANPVGRMMLGLFGENDERDIAYSDAVCSALQLINFTQDVREDLIQRDRLYLPLDEMGRFGVTETDLAEGVISIGTRRLMTFQVARALELLRSGSPLGRRLSGRLGLEIRLIILAAAQVAEKKLGVPEHPFSRPILARGDYPLLIVRALWHGVRPPRRQ